MRNTNLLPCMLLLGEWDGAGAVVKRAIRMHQIQHPEDEMANASHVVDFLKSRFSNRVASSYEQSKELPISREFWHIGIEDVDRSNEWDCRTIPGSSKFHSILGSSQTDPTLLLVRELSCFCAPCINLDWVNCEQQTHVSHWRVVRLRPKAAGPVQAQIALAEEPTNLGGIGGVGEQGDIVQLGDNFMIPAEEGNEEGVDFYILQCQRAKFQVQQDLLCPWGGDFKRVDYVISGSYYQKYGRASDTYVLLDASPIAYVDAHLVRHCKFPMVLASHVVRGNSAVYRLGAETEFLIKEALRNWWATDLAVEM